MKNLLLILLSVIAMQLSAQNIELWILPNSIKVKNDSLYFKYRIQNNSDTVFVLYNVRILDVAMDEKPFDADIKEDPNFKYAPRLFVFFYDKNGKFKPKHIFRMRGFQDPGKPVLRTYEDSINSISYGKYIVLNPYKFVEYDIRISIEDNIELIKGAYKFLLGYFSCDKYKQLYNKSKKQDTRLKNSVMFKGEIKSNVCTFEYPYVKKNY